MNEGVGWSETKGDMKATVTMMINKYGTFTVSGLITVFNKGLRNTTSTKNYIRIEQQHGILWKKERTVAKRYEALVVADEYRKYCKKILG